MTYDENRFIADAGRKVVDLNRQIPSLSKNIVDTGRMIADAHENVYEHYTQALSVNKKGNSRSRYKENWK